MSDLMTTPAYNYRWTNHVFVLTSIVHDWTSEMLLSALIGLTHPTVFPPDPNLLR